MEIVLIIAYTVFFLHVTTWEEHIFEDVANYLDTKLPEWIAKPLYGCPICMSFWWGWLIMIFIGNTDDLRITTLQVFAVGGINVINAIFAKFYDYLIDKDDK